MRKRILGWLRHRRVVVLYGMTWCLLLLVIAFACRVTFKIVSVQVDERHVWDLWAMCFLPIGLLILATGLMQIMSWLRESWRQSRPILTTRLILIAVFSLSFPFVLASPNGIGMGFYIGKGDPEPGLVSVQEVVFMATLFFVGALFQCILIEFEDRREEMNKVIGGILIIMGIVMPKLLESWSLLSVHCGIEECASGELDAFVLIKMGVAYAVGLSVMFVVGLFSESIIGFFRSAERVDSNVPQECSLASVQDSEVLGSASEVVAPADKENENDELPTECAPPTTGVSQDAVEGVGVPLQSEVVPASLSFSAVPVSGSGGVAVSKQLMSAAVSGVVAGACFSVVSRLFRGR